MNEQNRQTQCKLTQDIKTYLTEIQVISFAFPSRIINEFEKRKERPHLYRLAVGPAASSSSSYKNKNPFTNLNSLNSQYAANTKEPVYLIYPVAVKNLKFCRYFLVFFFCLFVSFFFLLFLLCDSKIQFREFLR